MSSDPTAAGLTALVTGATSESGGARRLAGSRGRDRRDRRPRSRARGADEARDRRGDRERAGRAVRGRPADRGPCGTSQAQYPRLTRRSTSSSTAQPSTPRSGRSPTTASRRCSRRTSSAVPVDEPPARPAPGGRVGPGLRSQRAIDRQARLRRPPERAALQIADRLWRNEGGRPSVHVRARPPTRRHWRHRQRRPSWSRSTNLMRRRPRRCAGPRGSCPPPERAATAITPLALRTRVRGQTGRFFRAERQLDAPPYSRDPEVGRRLWEVCVSLTDLSEGAAS